MIVPGMPVLTSTPGAGHIYYDNACTLVEPMLTRMSWIPLNESVGTHMRSNTVCQTGETVLWLRVEEILRHYSSEPGIIASATSRRGFHTKKFSVTGVQACYPATVDVHCANNYQHAVRAHIDAQAAHLLKTAQTGPSHGHPYHGEPVAAT